MEFQAHGTLTVCFVLIIHKRLRMPECESKFQNSYAQKYFIAKVYPVMPLDRRKDLEVEDEDQSDRRVHF